MLLNECERILRGDQAIYLAGIDDAHYYRVDNIEKAASEIPDNGFSILLSHTPEIYRQAAHGGFDLFVSGHTHGGHSACLGLSQSLLIRFCHGTWARDRENIAIRWVIPRSVSGHLSFPSALTVFPKTLHHLQCSG
jgi:predicted MPP superfamily phosphohydrolase